MKRYQICCLTYGELTDLASEAVQNLEDPEVEVTVLSATPSSMRTELTTEIMGRTEVFVAGSANLNALEKIFQAPVVGIKVAYQDYLKHLLALAKDSCHTRIGIVTYQEKLPYDFSEVGSLLGIQVQNIVYQDNAKLPALLANSGCTAILGGGYACETAKQMGLTDLLIYPGAAVIQNALEEAKVFARNLRNEKKRMLYYAAVIDESPNGIISIDRSGIITNYNPAAERYLGITAASALGKPSSKLFPALDLTSIFTQKSPVEDVVVSYRNHQLHLRKILMGTDNALDAAGTALITDLSDFRKSEMSYLIKERISAAKSGFVSKYRFSDIVGESSALQDTIAHAKVYASTNHNVLIYGETGTGKELLAQSICNASDRADQSFVAVNCAALPDNLLESELFGYKEGAFTGSAKGGHRGLFELANHGTIFLDEVGSVSPALQVRLLRVLQEHEIMRLGDDRIIPVDVRVISATNKSYQQMIDDGFRLDLLFRLNELELELPPLRSRGSDIALLFRSFLEQAPRGQELVEQLGEQEFPLLESYSWPGNIRELRNVCARFSILTQANMGRSDYLSTLQDCIGRDRLLADVFHRYQYHPGSKDIDPAMLKELSANLGYTKERLADLLGISRTTLWRMEKELN